MKRRIAISIIFIFVLTFSTPAVAYNESADKLKEGVGELVSAPFQIPIATSHHIDEIDFKPFGVVAGVVEGSGLMINKFISGVVHIITFPIDY